MEEEEPISPLNVSSVDEDHLSAMQSSKQARRSRVSLACQRCKHRKQRV